jgi:hypothetical protein
VRPLLWESATARAYPHARRYRGEARGVTGPSPDGLLSNDVLEKEAGRHSSVVMAEYRSMGEALITKR